MMHQSSQGPLITNCKWHVLASYICTTHWCYNVCHRSQHWSHALQVGSKNAVFFLGGSVKVATRKIDSMFVHELGINKAELEGRFDAQEASYAHH